MNMREEIAGLLGKWSSLTEAERQAIEQADWKSLAGVQADKKFLQEGLSRLLEQDGNSPGQDLKSGFRLEVQKLISMEMHNADLLSTAMKEASGSREVLERTSRNLRRVQSSYSQKREGVWNSYS